MKTPGSTRACTLLLAGLSISALAISASMEQAPPPEEQGPRATRFDVAVIKPMDPKIPNMQFMFGPGGTFNGAKLTVKFLIEQAYGLRAVQISGGPSWMDSDQFDIKGKLDGVIAEPGSWKGAMQKLLAERFQLKFHMSTKEMTAYALVVGKNGPKFKETLDDAGKRGRARGGRGMLDGTAITMQQLVEHLARPVERVIVDQTRLTGKYKIKLEWDEESTPAESGDAAPSLFTALQDQLGLKLEKRKLPVPIMIVDSLQKPSEN